MIFRWQKMPIWGYFGQSLPFATGDQVQGFCIISLQNLAPIPNEGGRKPKYGKGFGTVQQARNRNKLER